MDEPERVDLRTRRCLYRLDARIAAQAKAASGARRRIAERERFSYMLGAADGWAALPASGKEHARKA